MYVRYFFYFLVPVEHENRFFTLPSTRKKQNYSMCWSKAVAIDSFGNAICSGQGKCTNRPNKLLDKIKYFPLEFGPYNVQTTNKNIIYFVCTPGNSIEACTLTVHHLIATVLFSSFHKHFCWPKFPIVQYQTRRSSSSSANKLWKWAQIAYALIFYFWFHDHLFNSLF